jgi:hypothetical protein
MGVFEKRKSLLFLKKKKQKDFYFWCCSRQELRRGRLVLPQQWRNTGLFAFS